jgi:hypothetical protein
MEDVFDPKQGLRWTAKAEAGYTTTQISSKEKYYGEGTSNMFTAPLAGGARGLVRSIPPGNFNRAVDPNVHCHLQWRASHLRFALRIEKCQRAVRAKLG